MTRGRWRPSKEMLAREAHAVFINAERQTRAYSKELLTRHLCDPSVYIDFLKLCLEFDDSADLKMFRKGLLIVVKALGATRIAERAHISRMTLYRMLGKGGNPRLSSLVNLVKCLGMNIWIVDQDFIKRRMLSPRPKDEPHAVALPRMHKVLKHKKSKA